MTDLEAKLEFGQKNLFFKIYIYLLIDLDVNLVPLSVAANQRRGFTEVLHCDWLPPKVGQDLRRGRLVDISKIQFFKFSSFLMFY